MCKSSLSISGHFSGLHDPRKYNVRHQLLDIITIAICAVICGAETWTQVQAYGNSKKQWLEQFLPLPEGIPSRDTFGRVFAALDPDQFNESFGRWIQSICMLTNGDVVAIDGKTLRRSYDSSSNRAAIHMVSAWAAGNGMVLGQVNTTANL